MSQRKFKVGSAIEPVASLDLVEIGPRLLRNIHTSVFWHPLKPAKIHFCSILNNSAEHFLAIVLKFARLMRYETLQQIFICYFLQSVVCTVFRSTE